MSPTNRYDVSIWHGESRSLWYIVDTWDDDQPAVVLTCHSLEEAIETVTRLNALTVA